jgi:hypothetical protein
MAEDEPRGRPVDRSQVNARGSVGRFDFDDLASLLSRARLAVAKEWPVNRKARKSHRRRGVISTVGTALGVAIAVGALGAHRRALDHKQ